MEDIVLHGYNATITLRDNGMHIKPGIVGSVFRGGSFLSEKFIPYSSISGIEFRKGFPFIGEGMLQINTRGEVDSKYERENMGDAINQNVIRFAATLNRDFENISNIIRERIG